MTKADVRSESWRLETSWSELEVTSEATGVPTARYVVGHPDDHEAPVVVRATFPPGFAVAPHTHETDYTEIILEGSQQVTRRWHTAGDVRVVKAGTVYGPLVAGPDGATVLLVFRSGTNRSVKWVHPDRPTLSSNGYTPTGTDKDKE